MPPVLLLARRQSDTRQMKGITGSLQKAAWLQPEFEKLPIKWTMTPSSSLAAARGHLPTSRCDNSPRNAIGDPRQISSSVLFDVRADQRVLFVVRRCVI